MSVAETCYELYFSIDHTRPFFNALWAIYKMGKRLFSSQISIHVYFFQTYIVFTKYRIFLGFEIYIYKLGDFFFKVM